MRPYVEYGTFKAGLSTRSLVRRTFVNVIIWKPIRCAQRNQTGLRDPWDIQT